MACTSIRFIVKNVNAAEASLNTKKVNDLAADKDIKRLNIDIKEPKKSSAKLDKDTAIQRAKEIAGSVYSSQAKSIDATLINFTDSQIKKLPNSNTIPQDIDCWLVSFKGVTLKTHSIMSQNGQQASLERPNSEINVVINADTGEEIEMFAYK